MSCEIQDGRQDDWWRGLEMEFAKSLMYNIVQYHFPDQGGHEESIYDINSVLVCFLKELYSLNKTCEGSILMHP